MITYIDTDGVASVAAELKTIANDMEKEFNALFRRFNNVPTVTGEWFGDQSKYYFSRVFEDKKEYLKFVEEIRDLATEIQLNASNADFCIRANNK